MMGRALAIPIYKALLCFVITELVNGDARSATVSGLEPSTQYTVLVAAVNGAGTSEPTSIMVETGGE